MRCLVALFTALIPYIALAQPTADFTTNTTSGCAPIVVHFTDQSQGAVSWEWNTGVGLSTLQNPGILYLNPGQYTVTLVVTDAQGLKDTLTKPLFIEVYGYPTAQFQASPTDVCAHELISFSDQSTAGSGNITSWQWDFGDGNISTQPVPVHTYSQAGVYPVSLVVENQYGCRDELIRPSYITVEAPDPSFSADETVACGPPLTVNFTSTGNTGGTHFWDFGDGSSSTQVNPSHTYTQFGTFDVMHVVEDAQGCRDTLTQYALINIGVNTLSIQALDSSVCIFDTVFFKSNAPSNSTIKWDFGNGDSAFVANPHYIYTQAGTYIAQAEISDGSGCQVSLSIPITIHAKPQVNFSTRDTSLGCTVPFTVEFHNLTSGALSYEWNFGDGSPRSTISNPTHTYFTEDSFSVHLKAIGPGGCVAGMFKKRYIKVEKMKAGFVSDVKEGCAPLDVKFQDTTHSLFPINNWSWDLGNGNNSGQPNPQTTYQNPGQFDISMIVSNTQGCTDTVVRPAYITAGLKPNVDFVIDTNQACAYSPVQFTNLSTGAQNFIWYFSDGDTAMSTNPQHGFGALGMMDVMLVGNDRGCRDTMRKSGIINILAPLPIMGISDRRICELPKLVHFSDLSIGADTTSWMLNGSFMGNQRNWTHTFTQDGTYPVSMTVENFTTGCKITSSNAVVIETVTADFEPDTNRSCIPFEVKFWDRSTNAIDWTWHFDSFMDSSKVQNPRITYRHAGVYEPMLVVRNSLNCRDTFRYSSLHALDVNADFAIVSDSAGCVPLDVQFQDRSTGTGSIVDWQWNMGDSTFLNGQNPSHTFDYQSFFNISLKVTDVDGCVDSLTKANQIYATQPIPDFLVNPPVNCSDKNSVFLSLSSGAGLSYLWDFGDGNTSTLANASHSYAANGSYTVSLHVTDVNGCDSSITRPNAVLISEVDASFTADTVFAPCPPLTVNFEADTAFPHANLTYHWDFGDGATSSDPLPSHIYTLPGQYDVSLILQTPTGCSDTLIYENMITVMGPTAQFTFDPKEGCPGTTVNFDAQSTFNVTYDWIFGDGSTGTGQQMTHSYHQAGVYTPVLVVEDSAGCRVFHVADEDIQIHSAPEAGFVATDSSLCDSGSIVFTSTSIPAGNIQSYDWFTDRGDSLNGPAASITFAQTGSYLVGLLIEDNNGCRDTLEKPAFVSVYPSPEVSIRLSDSSGCAPLTTLASLNNQGHPYTIDQFLWSSNGKSGTDPTFQITYADSGNFDIVLEVEDVNHCVDTAQLEVIAHPVPQANFSASDSMGCSPFPVLFSDLSVGSIQSWEWTFGDGQGSQLAQPDHMYLADGQYDVGLLVRNSFGCEDQIIKEQYIRLDHPDAAFTVDPAVICPGEAVVFNHQSQSDTTLIHFEWDFGDNQRSLEEWPVHEYSLAGKYDVQLVVTDMFMCTDTLELPEAVTVLEDITPEAVPIEYVSVLGNQMVEISWEEFPNSRDDFGSYQILRMNGNGGYDIVGSLAQVSDTRFVDQLLDERLLAEAQCYKIMVLNRCGTGHDLAESDAHCTVNLSSVAGMEQVELSWTPYVGWGQLRGYRLFRVDNYNPNQMEYIDELPGNVLSYTDLDMYCYDTYSYRIQAVGPNPGLISFSDTTYAEPGHRIPDQPSDILRVSVENDQFLQIDWELAQIEDAVGVVLERNDGRGYKEIYRESLEKQSEKYQDPKVDVHSQSYTYRVFTVDTCGDYTPLGYPGKSVHLRTRQAGGKVELSWNSYRGWPEGVEGYKIEVFNSSTNSFDVLARVGQNDTSYIHKNADKEQAENCYRIIAQSAHEEETSSLSNQECQLLDPVLNFPNAFTPNDDGLNDEFEVKGHFLEQYQIQIFNRWGKMVYESNNLSSAWNGMGPNGKEVPEGVYVYKVEGRGQSGLTFNRTGTISLLR